MRLKFATFLLLYCIANLFANAQNVGIGTTSPSNKLSVNGTVDIVEKLGIGTTSPAGALHINSMNPSLSVIDQQQTLGGGEQGGYFMWQSFTAGVTGVLVRIDLSVRQNASGADIPGAIKIYEGEGVGGTLLSNSAVTFTSSPGLKTFNLANFANLIAGNKYSIEFHGLNSDLLMVDMNAGNPYPGGYTNSPSSNIDFIFKTYIVSPSYDALVVKDGKIGVGTATPEAPLHIVGNLKINDGSQAVGKVLTSDADGLASWITPTGGLSSGSTAGNTPYWDGTNWVTNSSNIYNNGTNVGVGNATPAAKLDIAGNIKITDGTQAVGKVLTSDANGLASWATPSSGLNNGAAAGNTPYWNGTNWVSNSSNIFNNGGNVGIGTTSPAGELHVKSSTLLSNTIDQQQLTNNSLPGTISPLWQSFTAGMTGQLTQVEFYIGAPNGASTAGFLKIYNGEGTGGALLSSTAVNFVNPLSFKSFTLSNPVSITAGNKYTIEVVSSYPVAASWMAGNNNSPYSGGITNFASNFPNLDFAFKTYVTPTLSVDGLIVAGGKVGVGTSNPTADLEVKNSGSSGLIKLNVPNLANGGGTAIVQGQSASTANQAEWVFQYAGPGSNNNAHAFGFNNIQPFVFFTAGQNVGIGTSAPTARLSVNGTANNISGSWGVFSDARIKTINNNFTDGLNVINKIRPVTFNYNANAPFKADGEQIGIVAQELETIAPYMVSKKENGDIKDLREVNNQAYVFLLINAVKELNAQNEELKKELESIKKKLGL